MKLSYNCHLSPGIRQLFRNRKYCFANSLTFFAIFLRTCVGFDSAGLRRKIRLPDGLLTVCQSASQIVDYTYIKSRAGQQLQLQLCGAADRYILPLPLLLPFLFRFFLCSIALFALCDCDFAHEKQTKPENVALHTESIMLTSIYHNYIVTTIYIYLYSCWRSFLLVATSI